MILPSYFILLSLVIFSHSHPFLPLLFPPSALSLLNISQPILLRFAFLYFFVVLLLNNVSTTQLTPMVHAFMSYSSNFFNAQPFLLAPYLTLSLFALILLLKPPFNPFLILS
jgi:hypothetical protein